MTPCTVIPLKMISLAKSTGTSPLGMPSSCTRPPSRTAANAWCRADGTPDISHTTSAPSPPVSSITVRTTSSCAALMVTCAPIWRASARRVGFTSDAITFAAPAARAMPTAKQPIGPHPTMKTVLPGMSAVSTAWNALPIGSMTAPTVVGMPFKGSTLVAGIAMYSANAPSRSTPMMRVLRQMWLLPVRHCRQWPHTMWPSAVTSCPVLKSATPSPTAAISPANSWPITSGGLRRPWAHASQSAMWRSVPHTPAWRTAISTSPGPVDGFATVVTFRPGARVSLTIACITRGTGTGKRERSEYGSREPTVHLQRGAGNIAGPLRCKERHRRCKLLGATHAPHRNAGDHLAHHVLSGALFPLGARLRQLGDAFGRDEPGTYHVDRDSLRGHLVRERLGEPEHARARGSREDESGQRLLRRDRREAHDAPPLQLPHDGDRRPRQVHDGQEVELHGAVERVGRLMAERRGGRAARVAEQHVEPSQLAVHPLDQALGLRLDPHVGDERLYRLTGLRDQLLRHLFNRALVPAVDRDAGALMSERLRDRASQSLGAATHERDTARETEIHGAGNLQVLGAGCRSWVLVLAGPPRTQHPAPSTYFTVTGTSTASIRTAQHFNSAI